MIASLPVVFNETKMVADICRDSFYEFVKEFWDTVIEEEPVWNWHMEYLCDELQQVAERVFDNEPKEYDLIINVPPGSSKSTIASVMFPAWVWTRMPSAKSLCGSYSYPIALDLSRKCRDVVTSSQRPGDFEGDVRPGYAECFPEIALREDQNTKGYFANTKKGIRYSVGTGGSVTGMHGHFLIIDDPLDPKQAASEAELKAANSWMTETLPSRKANKVSAVTIIIMQRLAEGDPSGERLLKAAKQPVKHVCLPADDSYPINPSYLKRKYVDGLLDPIRMPRYYLDEAMSELGEYGYAGQFGQSPIPRGDAWFIVDRATRVNRSMVPPEHKFHRIVRYWDKAGTDDDGAYTAGVKMGFYQTGVRQVEGKRPVPLYAVYVLDVVRGQWEVNGRERMIRKTAEKDGKRVEQITEQEPGSGGKESAENTVRNLIGFKVKVDIPKGDKAKRSEPFADQWNGGNVYIVNDHWTDQYIREHQYFPRGKYKDQVDASSGAFANLAKKRRRIGAL